MKTVFLTFSFWCAFTLYALPQWKNLYEKGKTQDSLQRVYLYYPEKREKVGALLLAQFKKYNDKEPLALLEVLKNVTDLAQQPQEQVDKFGAKVGEKYKAFPNVQARYYKIVGYHHFIGDLNYEKAFNAYLKLEKLLEIHGPKVITEYANYCSEIASAYYKFKNYKKAIVLNKKGLLHADNRWDFYNTIGLCYQELKEPDSAIYFLQKAVDAATSGKMRDIYRTISLGNIGYSYYVQKKYHQAKPLLQVDLNGALAIEDQGLAAGAAIPLADIYLTEKKQEVAIKLLQQARTYIAKSKQLNRLEKLFPVYSRYYQLKGQTQAALAYRDSAISAIKWNDSVYNSLLLMRVQQRTDLERLAEEKNKLENYKKLSETRILALIAIFIIVAAFYLVVRKYRNRIKKDKARIEDLNRMMALRQRLSADMHDDIGSTLSSISIYSHSLLMQPVTQQQQSTLEKIKENAQNVQESISDIIWSVNPDMDSMEQVVARMRSFGGDITEYAGVKFEFNTEETVIVLPLTMEVRKNVYLIYKEAVNNAVKYSNCTQISICLKGNMQCFEMHIVDDGNGFDVEKVPRGNGIANMRRRAEAIPASLSILSKTEQGTSISLKINVTTDS